MTKKKHDEKSATIEPLTGEKMRQMLWEEMHRVRSDKTTAQKANAMTNGANAIIRSVLLQLKYDELTGQRSNIPFLLPGKQIKSI